MHAFSSDGQHVVFVDAFGLTRLTLPKKLKTDKASPGSHLRLNGSLVLAHSARNNQAMLWDVSSLKKVKVAFRFSPYEPTALANDGAHVLQATHGGGIEVRALDNNRVGKYEADDSARDYGRVELGRRLEPLPIRTRSVVWTGPAGHFVVHDPCRGRLFGGILEPCTAPPRDTWVADVGAPAGPLSVIISSTGETFVSTWTPSEGKACCALLREDGVRTRSVSSDGPATFDGARIIYEREGAVVRESFEGEVERFDLSDREGPGELMAHGETLLRVSADRERILDVRTGAQVDRKLPAPEREARAYMLSVVQRANERGRASDVVFELEDLECTSENRRVPRMTWTFGERSLLSAISIGDAIARLQEDETARSLGTQGLPSYRAQDEWRALQEAELVASLAHMETAGLSLFAGLYYVADPLLTCLGRVEHEITPESARPLLSAGAHAALLRALVFVAKTGGEKGMTEAARAEGAVTAETIREHITAGFLDQFARGSGNPPQMAISFLLVDALRADALPILIDWALERPTFFSQWNPHVTYRPLAILVRLCPETREPMFAAIERAEAAGGEAAALADKLRSSLKQALRD